MMHKCYKAGLTQPAILCVMFDVLVRPVVSYGAHIWGPSMFARFLHDPHNSQNMAEQVHCDFLRWMSGVGGHVHKQSLYKEFGRYPLMLQWLRLAARWWNRMADKANDTLAHQAFHGDVELMLAGTNTSCWSRQFLEAMTRIKVVNTVQWHPRWHATKEQITALRFDEELVEHQAQLYLDRAWHTCPLDPDVSGADEVFYSTYKYWVGGLAHQGAKHMHVSMPKRIRQSMLSIKLGCHHLNVHEQRRQGIDRHRRVCTLCQCQDRRRDVEDICHFMLWCDAYSHIRAKYTSIFSSARAHGTNDAHTLRLIFDHPYQMQVACCIHEMLQHRRWCIEHPDDVPCVTFHASVGPRFPQATRDIEGQGDDMSYIVDMMDSDTDDDQGMVIWDADKGIILPADIEDIYA